MKDIQTTSDYPDETIAMEDQCDNTFYIMCTRCLTKIISWYIPRLKLRYYQTGLYTVEDPYIKSKIDRAKSIHNHICPPKQEGSNP